MQIPKISIKLRLIKSLYQYALNITTDINYIFVQNLFIRQYK